MKSVYQLLTFAAIVCVCLCFLPTTLVNKTLRSCSPQKRCSIFASACNGKSINFFLAVTSRPLPSHSLLPTLFDTCKLKHRLTKGGNSFCNTKLCPYSRSEILACSFLEINNANRQLKKLAPPASHGISNADAKSAMAGSRSCFGDFEPHGQ